MLTCAVCNEWTIGRLCTDCVVFRHAMTLYGKETVVSRVKQIFVRQACGLKKQTGAIIASDVAALSASANPS